MHPIFDNQANLQIGFTLIPALTPEMAKKLMASYNIGNRGLKNAMVNKYKKAMVSGEWAKELAEGNIFVFNTDGGLMSGQHRLQAAIDADYTFFNVVIHVANRTAWLKHSQEKRSAADRAQMRSMGRFNNKVSTALSKVAGQAVFLLSENSYVCTSAGDADAQFHNVVAAIGFDATTLDINHPKVGATKLAAVLCLLYANKIDFAKASLMLGNEDLVSDKQGIKEWFAALSHYVKTGEITPITVEGRFAYYE